MNFSAVPNTINFSGKKLSEIKLSLDKYPEETKIAKDRAEKLLKTDCYSVVYKKLVTPSGDAHDYMTMGTYWWPDPDKPDGLPYIRRDGVHNPNASDRNTYKAMSSAAYNLAVFAYLFENADYAKKAVEFLEVWHLNEDTYMNPHAEYAQAIPGICEGRGIGIIDFSLSYYVFEASEILYAIGAMPENTYIGLKKWYVDFANWLITSEKGIFEDNYFNNHGAWYDVQVLNAALFTSRPELARRVCMNTYRRRHKTHIMPDGAQPHELARTNAATYSMFNLKALVKLAVQSFGLGFKEGLSVDADAGVCLVAKAAEFIYPYAQSQSDFPYSQIKPQDFGDEMCMILRTLAQSLDEPKYFEMAKKIEKPEYLSNIMPMI